MSRPKGIVAKALLIVLMIGYFAFALWQTEHGGILNTLAQIARDSGHKHLSTLNFLDWIALGFIPAALGTIYLVLRAPRPPAARFFRSHERYALVFIVIAIIIFVLCVEVYDERNKTALTILIGALFATAGWIFTTYMGARNATKAHTMNILIQVRTSAEFNKHRANIQKQFGFAPKLPRDALAKIIAERDRPGVGYENDNVPVGDSIRYVLNFFEFMSAGVHLEDLDEELLRETMRSIFINFHNFAEDYISYTVGDDYGKKNERIYRHFRTLVKKFQMV